MHEDVDIVISGGVEMWRGGLGWAYPLPELSNAYER